LPDADAAPSISAATTTVGKVGGTVGGTVGDVVAERVQQARMQGYEGESCPECQNFTLVRNGTCLKCNTCGGTTGCS
jgi:ribonucleoside-diphosphate reductase alpha chain